MDFGVTTEGSASNEAFTVYIQGTSGYRSPEPINGSAAFTNKVDIWSLGCIVYELIVGSQLFRNDCQVVEHGREIRSVQVECPGNVRFRV